MELLDESVSCDSELLDWFSTPTWWDLSIALSMAMRANVEFPDREDVPLDDSRGELSLSVFDTVGDYGYPMTIRELLINALDTFDNSVCVQSWRELQDSVEMVERVRVSVSRTPFAPWNDWFDVLAGDYPYRRGAPGGWTVARWRDQRLRPQLPTHAVLRLQYPDGSNVPGQSRLSTLRSAWANEPPSQIPASTDPKRLFDVMREARWIGYVRSVTESD
jgi:hypothetical protein